MKRNRPDGKFVVDVHWKDENWRIYGSYSHDRGSPPSGSSMGTPDFGVCLEDVIIELRTQSFSYPISETFADFLREAGLNDAIIAELEDPKISEPRRDANGDYY